jgi:RNA polymerase subunit RPABC4/transcription elongation factor Spt4
MNAFGERLKIIPGAAWTIGILLSVIIALPILGLMRYEIEMQQWPTIGKAGLLAVIPVVFISYAGLVGFIYADAKRRHMRHVMWAWLAIIPYFIGVILYFILRDPLPSICPHCQTTVPRTFAYCPGCGSRIHPVCSQCGKPIQIEWKNCPHCGSRIELSNLPI